MRGVVNSSHVNLRHETGHREPVIPELLIVVRMRTAHEGGMPTRPAVSDLNRSNTASSWVGIPVRFNLAGLLASEPESELLVKVTSTFHTAQRATPERSTPALTR